MNLGQVIEYNNMINVYLKNHKDIKAERLVPEFFLFFRKALY